jgi:hypothetical protein
LGCGAFFWVQAKGTAVAKSRRRAKNVRILTTSYNDTRMHNRCAVGVLLVFGIALMGTGCYNNPEVSAKPPGAGSAHFHRNPQVGPGTTAGGSTAGPQPVQPKEHTATQPTHSGATGDTPGLGHAGAATPEMQHGAGTPAGTPSATGNQKGVGDRTVEGGQGQHATPATKH